MTCRNVLVVDGLDPSIVLLSVRSLRKRDGIKAYFNDDNKAGVNDFLGLPSGIYTPFSAYKEAYELTVGPPKRKRGGVLFARNDRSKLNRLSTHAALCHAGATRLNMSNVRVNGLAVKSICNP